MDEERNYCRKRSCVEDNHTDDEANKRRDFIDKFEVRNTRSKQTVYRYLCPKRRIGCIIGRGGEFVNQIRADTGARIIIEEPTQHCIERPVTIFSSSEKTNPFSYVKVYVCPAQDALFRVHERLFGDEHLDRNEVVGIGAYPVTARLLIPSDQARRVIGRCGSTIQSIRMATGATINVWKDKHIPFCASSGEELLEIIGDALTVKDALFQISCILHEHPSLSHDPFSLEASWNPSCGNESCTFTLCLVCPSVTVRDVIGTGCSTINQIRQESGAKIELVCHFDDDDYLIFVSAKEFAVNSFSPTINAAIQLQPRCSSKESEYGETSFVTRILVPQAQLGRVIGKGGSIIKEIRRKTQARISILEESLPSIVPNDDDAAIIQISGDPISARSGLIEVIEQLKAIFYSSKCLFPVDAFASSSVMSRNDIDSSIYTDGSHEQQQNCRNSSANEHSASLGKLPLNVDEPFCGSQDDGDG